MTFRLHALLVVVVALLVASPPLRAHHGSASFDTDKELTLQGTVTEWLWANPHCFLKFDVKDEKGTVNWSVEMGNPTDISVQGYRRTTFKPGEMVTVVLQPVKSGAPVGRLRRVTAGSGQKFGY